jgi:cell division protein FtsN
VPEEKYQEGVAEPSDSGADMDGKQPRSSSADNLKSYSEKAFRQWFSMKRSGVPVLIFVILAAGYLVITRAVLESPQAESTGTPALFEPDNQEEGIPPATENIPDPGQKKESNAGDSPAPVADTTHIPAGPGGSADVSTAENKPSSGPQQSPVVRDASCFVHAYSYRNQEDAARQAERLRRFDFPVQVQSVDVTDSGIWYRVLFGPFSTPTKARSVQKNFVAATGVQDSRILQE